MKKKAAKKTTKPQEPPVCIMGMHRSGTSLIARAVQLLGVSLGPPNQLIKSASSWPPDLYENVKMMQFNNYVLSKFHGAWHTPPRLPVGWEDFADVQPLVEQAKKLIAKTYRGNKRWAWKDPRNSLTFPLWRKVLDGRVRAIICIRNPVEVCGSMQQRDAMNYFQASRLWKHYTSNALVYTNDVGVKTTVVAYEDVLHNAEEEFERIACFLGVDPSRKLVEEFAASVDKGASRNKSSVEQAIRSPSIDPGATYLYAILRGIDGNQLARILR